MACLLGHRYVRVERRTTSALAPMPSRPSSPRAREVVPDG
ncbi:hypothetical protein AKJ09_08817 [Labilithrix luteola]|uniref:Uncharacterized protein n=1 Tax=Labilithrix luteola TaxID=1391654 RepID=A0A0K1Q8U0_9BACT|nr:hypothetical protein AKJ09_08817 [Labilithrix luteola]